jgi:UDP-N-acetyl-2-amino-2-deoxyglucuronate dehydrogenase
MFEPIRNRRIRLAIVGCGRISKNHFDSIAKHAEDVELAAVCDNDPAVLAGHVKQHSVPGYASLGEMLQAEDKLDLVALCTPSGIHPDQAIAAAQAGVHVMTEKPMGTRWQDGVRMVKACDEAGVRLFVVKQNRLNSTLQMLKRVIDEKRFGKIHMVHLNVFWSRPQSYYDQARWRGTWEFDGGALMNQASHYVDLLDWLIGPVDKVQAMVSTTRDIEVEDSGVVNVRWRNGALGSISVTMLTYPENLEGSITILGERGTVRVGGVAVNEIQIWQFDEARDYDEKIHAATYDTTSVYGFGHALYYRNVIEVLRGTAEPTADGREGLKSLELLIAAYLSARDGKTVSLPLEY